eukprot:scaffold71520_cov50-Attheya_sp.AAC.5
MAWQCKATRVSICSSAEAALYIDEIVAELSRKLKITAHASNLEASTVLNTTYTIYLINNV